ncbi:MAG TPA: bifunctional dTDP-4-dehydrorhamnose 3,5-epimerase family protein/NAD(P)-dependent oxidoreductase [Propionibacteriaceae bacterium]
MVKAVRETPIPGLLVVDLDVRGDNRGWFKENWQRQKMLDAGVHDFGPVQNNVSYNAVAGATRGIHAEPWDKLVSLATGRIFGAWVDLRAGDSFGRVFTLEMGPETAVFVPRGVGNAFQTLEDGCAYSYLVNDHWSPAAKDSYTFVNLADETLAISWPIPLERAEMSAADRAHPRLAEVQAMTERSVLVLGAHGQLGRALTTVMPTATGLGRDELDLTDSAAVESFAWGRFDVLVNAAAYTAVDEAETPEGRRRAWATNVVGLSALAGAARRHRLPLVQISSDYVFDGTQEVHHEDEALSPLGVYGQTKAAGDAVVGSLPAHYLIRTSWVIGDGANFVRTMASLADRGIEPSVVDDQHGRLTFTNELARAIQHLIGVHAPYGTYNVTGAGPAMTWAEVARRVFRARGRSTAAVQPVSTEVYGQGKSMAPRPQHSVLSLDKITATGFEPVSVEESLNRYLDLLPPAQQ